MTTSCWALIRPQIVPVESLLPTQETNPEWVQTAASFCGDPFPHVVLWKGKLYINDGHHRVERCRQSGARWLMVRLLIPRNART